MTILSRLLFHPVTLLVIVVLAGVFSWSLQKNLQRMEQSRLSLEQQQQVVADLQLEVTSLEDQVAEAGDPLTQEKIIRNELLMQKPGEYVVQIPDAAVASVSAVAQETHRVEIKTPWQEWRELLF